MNSLLSQDAVSHDSSLSPDAELQDAAAADDDDDEEKEIAKISNSKFFYKPHHMTHLLKLVDKMCEYEMDPAGSSTVEDTERTRPQTDRQTDGQMDKVKPVHPLQLHWV